MAFTKVTDPVDNITTQPNKPIIGATALKALFDETGKDLNTYINSVLTPELESTTDGDSGADNIGATALAGGVSSTVQGILEELDAKAVNGTGALNTHKASADHDGRYFTEAETTALLLANQQGNHLGTWQGYSPIQSDPGIQAIVNEHTAQLAKSPIYFNTVAEMKSSTIISIGDFVVTLGYFSINDNGGALYKIIATSGTADNGILIDLTGISGQASILGSTLNTRQLGLIENDQCQTRINDAIWRTETKHLTIVDKLRVFKEGSGVTNIAQILPKSNFTLEFLENSSLTLFPSANEDYYRMISIEENRGRIWDTPTDYHKENITVINPILIGDSLITTETVGEFGDGIHIFGGVENIKIVNPKCYNMFGDGYVVAGNVTDGLPLNVYFNGITYAEKCRRQGMSVGGCTNLYVESIHAVDIEGAAPSAAIDFEPDAVNQNIINAYVGRIYGENVRRGVLVTGFANKQISIGEVITDQISDTGVGSGEVELHGNGYKIDVSINRVYSKNAKDKNILYFRNTNKYFNCNIGVVEAENYYKTSGSNPVISATVLHEFADPLIDFSEAGNIHVDKIRLINPTYESTKFDYYVFLSGGTSLPTLFKNIHLPIENPLTANVDSNINIIKLKNSLIVKPNFSAGTTQTFGFDEYEIIPMSEARYFCNPFDILKVNNPKNFNFFLSYQWFTDYTLEANYTGVTVLVPNLLLYVQNFNGYITLNHTTKKIAFKKIAFDATY